MLQPGAQKLGSSRKKLPYNQAYLSSWWFQSPLKNISQIGSFPQVGMNIKNI